MKLKKVIYIYIYTYIIIINNNKKILHPAECLERGNIVEELINSSRLILPQPEAQSCWEKYTVMLELWKVSFFSGV